MISDFYKFFDATKQAEFLFDCVEDTVVNIIPNAIKYLSKVFLDFEMDFSPIPMIKESEAKKITKPLTIIGADNDLVFPGEKLLKRAKSIFPSLKKVWLLDDSKHVLR